MPGVLGVAAFLVTGAMLPTVEVNPPTESRLFTPAGVMCQLEMTPTHLAAAGLDADDVDGIFDAIAVSGACQSLRAVFTTLEAAETREARVEGMAALRTALRGLRSGIVAELAPEHRARLSVIAAHSVRDLPPDIAAAIHARRESARPEQVRRMLIAERRAQRLGREVDQSVASELAAIRAHPAAVAVRANLSSNLAEVEEAFTDSLGSGTPPP